MRLKKLEIKGFKSFADETVVHFNEDVIGIVGPNGSGKSNIVDAIRWVLGEQSSRELRLDQMSSVIFNGTKKRRAAPFAKVALSFDNTKNILPTEYQEVSIARILYASGDSEYQLNGVTCRLRDIRNLLMDTGIGSNSYAIIALGMVDDILTDKENSRLKMFEQAAGISKYKVRKRETLNKLKNTEGDLERVEDLLHEINSNLKMLEAQAKKAKRYFEIKQDYKEKSIELATLKASSIKTKLDKIKEKLTKEEDKYRGVEVEITKLEAAIEEAKKSNLDKEKLLSNSQKAFNDLVGKIRDQEGERNMLNQRLEFITQNREKLTSQIESNKGRIGQLEEELTSYRERLAEEKAKEAGLEKELDEAKQQLEEVQTNHSSAKAGMDTIMATQKNLEVAVFELEKQKAINTNRLENLVYEKDQMEVGNQQRDEQVKELDGTLKTLLKKEGQQKETLEKLQEAADKRQTKIIESEGKLVEMEEKATKLNRELDSKKNEFQLTQSMVESMEGFPESIKFLSSQKEWKKKAPLLSDLIYVDEAYRVAIENYLEPYLNYYVVPTLKDAYSAIQLLSQSQKGKANFFVLEAFEKYNPPVALLPGTRNAYELVQTDAAYRKLTSYLLENVLVTENEDVTKVKQEGDFVILSQSGRFIKRRFSLSGGSIGLFEGKKIGRKKNLEVLEKAIKKLEKEELKQSTELYNLKSQIEQLKSERDDRKIQQAREALDVTVAERIGVQSRFENIQTRLNESNEKFAKLSEESTSLTASNKTIELDLATKSQEVEKAIAEIAEVDSSYREMSEQLSAASAAYNEKNINFIRQQNMVGSLQRELNFRESSLSELKSGSTNAANSLEEQGKEATEIEAKIKTIIEGLQENYGQRKERQENLTEVEQTYFKARGGIHEIEDDLRKFNRQRNDSQVLINNLKDKLNTVRFDMTSLAERLRVEFNVEVKDLKTKQLEGEPKELMEKEIRLNDQVGRLKNRLDNYGEINPMAVEAYDAMKERYDSITQQRDDILKAKDDLLETIKEIEDTATVQFLEAFGKVRTYFIEAFRSLFTEDDTADLILLNPDNPLESKIEIIAKPKGKRPQTIAQLSGGEKTLTATALLFSLYLLKPAPFCIFDEVDAPLDDANIGKFNRIIKRFSKESQFIIVTHNKLTMAAVDVIYGISMPEQGVSTVTPVDFRGFDTGNVLEAVG